MCTKLLWEKLMCLVAEWNTDGYHSCGLVGEQFWSTVTKFVVTFISVVLLFYHKYKSADQH